MLNLKSRSFLCPSEIRFDFVGLCIFSLTLRTDGYLFPSVALFDIHFSVRPDSPCIGVLRFNGEIAFFVDISPAFFGFYRSIAVFKTFGIEENAFYQLFAVNVDKRPRTVFADGQKTRRIILDIFIRKCSEFFSVKSDKSVFPAFFDCGTKL